VQKVGTGLVIGLIGQLALLIALGATVSLSIFGWAVGVGYAVFTTVTLGRGLTRAGATRLGPANRVTLARAMLVGGVAALTADSFVRPAAVTALVAVSVIALALDAVDGWVARRTNSVTPLGARFDREVDAFLILVLSVYVAHSTGQWWVLLIGAARYVYGAAGWLLPWLRGPLPPRYWGKVVAAIQGIVLTVAAADILPIMLMNVALGVALALLLESFGSSVWWLWQQRQSTDVPAVEMAVAAVQVDGTRADGAGVDGAGVDGAEQEPDGRRDGPKHRLPRRSGLRTAAAWSATVLACLLVWFALVAPNDLNQVTLGAFVRLPVEGLFVVAIALVLPPAGRRILAAVVGVILGLLTILKLFDMGFFEAFDRPFNPVADWTYGGSAIDLLIDSIGRTGAIAVVIAAVALIVGLLILMPLALVRLTRLASEHRTTSIRSVTAVGAVWILCAAFGLQIVQGAPIASASAAELTYDQVSQVRDGIAAQEAFGAAVADDPFDSTSPASAAAPTPPATPPPLTPAGARAAVPPMLKAAQATKAPAAPTPTPNPAPANSLLSALKGKDVIIAFVESYGRVAVQGSSFSPGVDAVLDAGTDQLHQAGFSAKSAFLTSPTFGGISWLAHSTLQSGLWVDNQVLYDQLIASNRLTLTSAFKRAGWRTVADTPATERPWPEGQSFYHYDKIYDANNVGYQGPTFGYAPMTDQYTLSAFQRNELAPQHQPLMAEMDLVSSHWPWAPLPQMVDWNDVGDGSIFDPMPAQGHSSDEVWSDPALVQAAYGQSIEYTMSTLTSFVQNYGDPNLVMVVLGDHQPAAVVTGDDPTHDVPISIIAHDPAVLQKIDGWGWQDGLRPDSQAPVWRMDSFRDRFLTAYQ
jgi:phosphatidylglycerophosphate synthase